MSRRIVPRLLGLIAAVAALAGPAGPSPGAPSAPATAEAPPARVIVQATTVARAARAVQAQGGRVERDLPIVDGVAAVVPAARVGAVAAAPGVRSVTPNDLALPLGDTAEPTPAPAPRSVFNTELRVDRLRPYGITGRGVTVAVIDTGVARVPDLATPNADGSPGPSRVVAVPDPDAPKPPAGQAPRTAPCANLSGEGRSDGAGCRDDHGHGTFMAGLIAGNGQASGGRYTGAAPEAAIADIKIGGRTGAADVSKILAAIQYVVAFKDTISPPVRVINLSLGTTSRQHHRDDPLNYAVQRAWTAGLAVVVSAGNTGDAPSTVTKPGDDPLVITVGAVDDLDTPSEKDDRLPRFTARGPATFRAADGTTAPDTVAKPDVVAPGAHLVSLRPVDASGAPTPTEVPAPSPGSWSTAHYRRGSGTSMSTALVSGVAALYAQTRGSAWGRGDPDRLKAGLVRTAVPVATDDRRAVGAGLVQAPAALARAHLDDTVVPAAMTATGTGLLGVSRGQAVLTTRPCTTAEAIVYPVDLDPRTSCPVVIEGERTAQDMAWDSGAYRAGFDGSSWYGSSWYGSSWYASQWNGSSWYGSSWYGSSWYGSSWYGSSWYGSFDGTSGYGATVNGSSWYGAWD